MNLKIPRVILSLGCTFLSTGANTVWALLQPPSENQGYCFALFVIIITKQAVQESSNKLKFCQDSYTVWSHKHFKNSVQEIENIRSSIFSWFSKRVDICWIH